LLGALVAANAPALAELDISDCNLRDNALRPVVGALARNTHLRTLNMCANGASKKLVQRQLLPALARSAALTECIYGDVVPTAASASSSGGSWYDESEESDEDDEEEEE
jgi:hypothetical protein